MACAAGGALALKAIKPDLEIVGVQAERYPFMQEALSGHQRSVPTAATTIAHSPRFAVDTFGPSHGCVRLTNWDAERVADRVAKGTPVAFVDALR
jgi:hypothetical protein